MLNWPGTKAKAEAGVSSMVATSAVSRRTRVTGTGIGRRLPGDGARPSSHASGTLWPVDIRHLQTHRSQPFPHRTCESLHQLIAEIVISLAFLSQASSIDPEDPHELGSAGIECPTIGWYQPRPIQNVILTQGCDDDRLLTGGMQLEGHRALPKQVELIGWLAFTKQIVPGSETQVACTAGDRR